jgi:hypothetical protein
MERRPDLRRIGIHSVIFAWTTSGRIIPPSATGQGKQRQDDNEAENISRTQVVYFHDHHPFLHLVFNPI